MVAYPFQLLFALLIGHALADYPLQGEFLAKAKNHTDPIPGVPWEIALGSHALIHGGVVWALTGQAWLGLLEAVAHTFIDHAKCAGGLTFRQDQALHAICKMFWVFLAIIAAGAR